MKAKYYELTEGSPYTDPWRPFYESVHFQREISVHEEVPVREGDVVFAGDSHAAMGPWTEAFGTLRVCNLGISGDNTTGLLHRFSIIVTCPPAAVFISIGSNDSNKQYLGLSVDEVVASVRVLVERLRQAVPETDVFLLSTLPESRSTQAYRTETPLSNEFNERYAALAGEGGHLRGYRLGRDGERWRPAFGLHLRRGVTLTGRATPPLSRSSDRMWKLRWVQDRKGVGYGPAVEWASQAFTQRGRVVTIIECSSHPTRPRPTRLRKPMTHGPPRRSSQGAPPAPRDVGHAPGPPPHSSDAAGELDAASGLTPDQEELLALLLAESAPEAAPTPGVASADAPLVVPLKTQGTGPALFAVGVFHFRALAERLDTERPFYGLMGQDVNPDVPYLDQVADLASRYAAVVCQAQPEGPYHLVGFCFGGVVAFEMARQLRARGAEVGALVLIEAFPPEAPTDELNEQRSRNDRLRRHWEAIKERGPRYVLEWVRQRKDYERTRASMVGRRLLARHVYRFEDERPEWYGATVRLETEAAAASGYVPGSYDGDVLAVVGTSDLQRPACSTFDPGQAAGMWADFVLGSVDVVTFASDRHGDILDVPLVSNLAELVEREVGRTSSAGVRSRRTPR